MPIPSEDRPISALRSETVDRLIMNYGHGRLSLDAFERRLDEALDAQSHEALAPLTADLDLEPDTDYIDRKRAELGMAAESDRPVAARQAERMVNVFSGTHRRGIWTAPETIHMFNVFGGCELDFSQATFSSREVRIKMHCVFGGAKVLVSEDIDVVSEAICIFGGVDNRGPCTGDPDARRIVIEGLLLFGGARVRVKRSWRETCIAFADSIRSMFAPPTDSQR